MDRRTVLKASMSAVALPFAGCCTLDPAAPLEKSRLFKTTATPLAPTRVSANKYVARIVDPHCHIFNASDLQVSGFLKGPIAYSSDSKALRILIGLLADGIEVVAQNIALSATDELNDWSYRLTKMSALEYSALTAEAASIRTSNGDALGRQLEENGFFRQASRILEAEPSALKGAASLDRDAVAEALEASTRINTIPDDACSGGLDIAGLLTFGAVMLSPRWCNLMLYKSTYTEQERSLGVTRCYASMVDFDYWIGKCDYTRSSIYNQMLLMKKLSELSGGYMQPIMAYNPWKDMRDDNASLRMVEEALTMGFAGVKIYPPMGYAAGGNAENTAGIKSGRRPKDLKALDDRMDALYEVCRRFSVPVMAHANNSLGQKPSYDDLGGPPGWEAMFSNPANHGTRVSLGHFGGDDPEKDDWPMQFAELMKNQGTKYLFGDIGFWEYVACNRPESIKRLVQALEVDLGDGETVADRVMFGTDYLMLTRFSEWANYPQALQDNLAPYVDDATLEKLFFRNAERLFG